jgi:phage-related holin
MDQGFWYYITNVFSSWFSTLTAFILGVVTHYWTDSPEALQAALVGALCCAVADTVLGVVSVCACAGQKYSSHKFSMVFRKLLVYMMCLLASYGMDYMLGQFLGKAVLFQMTIASLICFREVSSLLEHSAVLGVPWPDVLKRKLEAAQKRMDECIGDAEVAQNALDVAQKNVDDDVAK